MSCVIVYGLAQMHLILAYFFFLHQLDIRPSDLLRLRKSVLVHSELDRVKDRMQTSLAQFYKATQQESWANAYLALEDAFEEEDEDQMKTKIRTCENVVCNNVTSVI